MGEVAEVLRGKRLTKSDMLPDGKYPVFHGGIEPIGYFNACNRDENTTMVINVGASAGTIGFSKVQFWSSDGCFCISKSPIIFSKYLYYYLQTQEQKIKSRVRVAGIPTLDNKVLENLSIPIPPLEVQEEIVRILDKFSLLTAELEAELELRRKQYDFYRNLLLSFDSDSDTVQWKKLGEICHKVSSGGTPTSTNKAYYQGNIPWLRTQEVNWTDIYDTELKITDEAIQNSSAKLIPSNCVIVAMYGATAAKVAINKIPLTTNQACCNLEINPSIALYRYVFHWLSREYLNLKALGQGSQSNINAQIIKNYSIPIPPLSEQQRIVDILDRFDALVNDLSAGLPAEIEARRKQYEYYRDTLLTFKRKAE